MGNADPESFQYWANIAHKFNLKLGGINQSLARDRLGPLSDGKAMLVGMDVTHPSPGSVEGAPSIAGVVASIDGHYGQWPASMRAQKSKQEMIAELHAMFKERLTLWEKHNRGALPERIIIYRDGVSEGQYRTLLHDELPQVRAACKEKYAGGRSPQISIIVCGKRHHTRFYPTNEKDADMYNGGNPLSGTVVDRGVTMEKGWDFFLQAHSALQGTAKPTHYVIIHDENGMKADQMEAMVSCSLGAYYVPFAATDTCELRRIIYATCLAERRRLCHFVHPLTMRTFCVKEAGLTCTHYTTRVTT